MKAIFAILVAVWMLAPPGAAAAQPGDHDRDWSTAADRGREAVVVPDHDVQTGTVNDGVVGEACYGDRYESDADVNAGNTVSDEEIRRILDHPGS